jgi:hypothetical protein
MFDSLNLRRVCLGCAGLALSMAAASAFAQGAIPAGTQVKGAQLQAWLDQGFGYAGVHRTSGCLLMNTAGGGRRVLFMRCPDGWSDRILGTAKVSGDSYCTNFPIPNSPPGDDCVTWHSLGDWKFEQRKGGAIDTTVILLPQGLNAGK